MTRLLFGLIVLHLFYSISFGQDEKRSLHNLTIIKDVNDNAKVTFRKIEVDSSGNIYKEGIQLKEKLDIEKFSEEIRRYVFEENILLSR